MKTSRAAECLEVMWHLAVDPEKKEALEMAIEMMRRSLSMAPEREPVVKMAGGKSLAPLLPQPDEGTR